MRSSHQTRLIRILMTAAAITIAGMSLGSAGEEIQTASQAEVVNTTSVPNSDRFEGYVFLDAAGHALPFQSDEEIEKHLRTATVVSVSKIPVGVSRPKKVLFAADSLHFNAVFKFIDEKKKNVRDPTSTGRGKLYLEWRDSYIFDIAAYQVDRLMSLNRVPPIVLRKIKGNPGSVQIWVEGTITENMRREDTIDPPEIARFNQQRSTMNIFDNLVANRDSNLGNTLIDGNWRLWFIDCSRCFGTSTDLLYPDAVTHCDRQMWDALRKLDRSAADKALSPYLSRLEIDVLFKRRDKLVDLLQARIDEWGEELVLFDQRPPTETAPWVGE